MRQRVIYHHPNERMAPDHLASLLRDPRTCIRGCLCRTVHPKAEKLKVRYIGTSEMTALHYPGDPEGDPEDQAAHATMQWLGSDAGSDEVVVWDVHNNDMPGLDVFYVGRRALAAAIAGAYRLGNDRCILEPSSFTEAVQNAGSLELSLSSPRKYPQAARRLWRGFQEISELTSEELTGYYQEIAPKLRFYGKYAVPTLGQDGRLAEYLPELEAIELPRAFLPLDGVSRTTLDALGIRGSGKLYTGVWGHRNESKDLPGGGGRKVYFGSILQEIDGPTAEGGWVCFR